MIFLSRYVNFNEFLDIVIDRQGDAHDIYDEIMQGFKMFDYGKLHLKVNPCITVWIPGALID